MFANEQYLSMRERSVFRRRAVLVWAAMLVVAAAWLVLIGAAPILRTFSLDAATPIYGFFGYLCHQIAARSFFLLGSPLAVCARCFGVYAGLLVGFAAYPLWRQIDDARPLPRLWLILAMAPIGIDWSLTIFGIWENTHLSRFLTGGILGGACATFIMPAAVEIICRFAIRQNKKAAVERPKYKTN